jgi:hypothetical protein
MPNSKKLIAYVLDKYRPLDNVTNSNLVPLKIYYEVETHRSLLLEAKIAQITPKEQMISK